MNKISKFFSKSFKETLAIVLFGIFFAVCLFVVSFAIASVVLVLEQFGVIVAICTFLVELFLLSSFFSKVFD